jgi:hypothetical protein
MADPVQLEIFGFGSIGHQTNQAERVFFTLGEGGRFIQLQVSVPRFAIIALC